MDTELFKLCKEVCEKKLWNEDIFDFEYGLVLDDEDKQMPVSVTLYGRDIEYTAPLYTSDYLLEKLPGALQPGNEPNWLTVMKMFKDKPPYFAGYIDEFSSTVSDVAGQSADTPLKALLKLVLALYEAGELK